MTFIFGSVERIFISITMLSTSRLGLPFSMMTRLLLNKRCASRNSNSDNNNSNDGTGAKSTLNNQSTKESSVNSSQNEGGPILLSIEDSFGKKDNKGKGEGTRPVFNPEELEEEPIANIEDLTPPTNCCMTGCTNCVWLEYAENLTKVYTNPELSKEKVMRELMAMEDQNIKAFIMFELRIRGLL